MGESKCYRSDYRFKAAFENSLNSIVDTVTNFNKELDLYIYDDFIEPELEEVALKYKSNELENVKFELVCLIAFNEKNNIEGKTEAEIKDSIKSIIENRCAKFDLQVIITITDSIEAVKQVTPLIKL